MHTVELNGIPTRYEVTGSGPALLMFSPGGFDARLENWSTHGLYARIRPVEHLSESYTCIVFDRRESGESGGRLERVTWSDYVAQGKALLDHLGLEQAHVMGGCVGCSIAARFALTHPESTLSMVLVSPAGGARYRMLQHDRFFQHLAFVKREGMAAVVELAKGSSDSFSKDGRLGPWAAPIRTDPEFAARYAASDPDQYAVMVAGLVRLMFDRDTVPGVEPEDLMRSTVPALIIPGQDPSHATSAAHYLDECLPDSQYWDVPVAEQTEDNAPARIMEFLASVSSRP